MWGNLECFLFGHVTTAILYRNHGNTSIGLLLDVRLFICLYSSSLCMPWRYALFETSYLLNLHASSSKGYHVITCSFQVPAANFQSKCRRPTWCVHFSSNFRAHFCILNINASHSNLRQEPTRFTHQTVRNSMLQLVRVFFVQPSPRASAY